MCPVGNGLFYADGRTDRHDEATRFSVFRTHGENGIETFHDFLQIHFVPLSAVYGLILVRSHLLLILNVILDTPLFPYTSVSLLMHSSCSNQYFDFFTYKIDYQLRFRLSAPFLLNEFL